MPGPDPDAPTNHAPGSQAAIQAAIQPAGQLPYRDLFERALVGILQADLDGRCLVVNLELARCLGYDSPEQLLDAAPRVQDLYLEPDRWWELVAVALEREQTLAFESQVRHRDGGLIWISQNVLVLRDETGQPTGILSTVEEVTQRKETEGTLSYLAFHDPMTGLCNERLLGDRLYQAVARAGRAGQRLAVIFLDIDRFKEINDQYGHAIGDGILRGVAGRFAGCLRRDDTASRKGGDEFVVVLSGLGQPEDACKVASAILEVVSQPWVFRDCELQITMSAGIALYPDDDDDPQALLDKADAAMYRAKQQGGGQWQLYTPDLNTLTLERIRMVEGLREAIARQEFVLHYSPQVDTQTGETRALEALLRWQKPHSELRLPSSFLRVAEDNGLMSPIGEWVLQEACGQNKAWQDAGLTPVRIVVNLSPRQFQSPELVEMIQGALSRTGLQPRYLELDIPESALMQDLERSRAVLSELRALGVTIAIDDFGAGCSSLASVARLPFDLLKIDRSLVRDVATDAGARAVADTVVTLARGLARKVAAEGVETDEQFQLLRAHGCDLIQGYLVAEPLPKAAIRSHLTAAG